MTSNDGDGTKRHHEGRKRERAKRKGGVLVMQRRERGAGGRRACSEARDERLASMETGDWTGDWLETGEPVGQGRNTGPGAAGRNVTGPACRDTAAGEPVASKGRADSGPPRIAWSGPMS